MSRNRLKRKNGGRSGDGLNGKFLVLDALFYDTLLYGIGQDLEDVNAIFSVSDRINQTRNLCNLEKVSEFGKNAFLMQRCGVLYHSNGVGLTPLQKMQYAAAMVYYSRLEIEIEGSRKQQMWVDQCAAGGGLNVAAAIDQAASATDVVAITNGLPAEHNQWTFRRVVPFKPGETFTFRHTFMNGLVGGATAPKTACNADATSNRLYRVYTRGVFARPVGS